MTCSGKAPYMARNFTPSAFGLYRVADPPSSLGHSSGGWVCVMWNSILFSLFLVLTDISHASSCPQSMWAVLQDMHFPRQSRVSSGPWGGSVNRGSFWRQVRQFAELPRL